MLLAVWLSLTLQAAPLNEVNLGISNFTSVTSSNYGISYYGLRVSYYRSISFLSLGGGIRVAYPFVFRTLPLDIYTTARVQAHLHRWYPVVGIVFGVSGYFGLVPYLTGQPTIRDVSTYRGISPFYWGFEMAPLRFKVGTRLMLSFVEGQVTTTFAPPGSAVRLLLEIVNIGVSL